MTTNVPSSTKKILLLLAGLGALGAVVLIGLGSVLFFSQVPPTPVTVDPTLTQTPTATPPPLTPTVMASVVVLASPTPVPLKITPQTQATDTLSRLPTATRISTTTPTPTAVPQRRQEVTVDGSVELI